MAKIDERARERNVPSSYFLGCFGFSRKIYSDKGMVETERGGEMNTKMKKNKKPSRWLLCSKFRSKNREIKPAPIEETEKQTLSVEHETDKKKPVPLISRMADRKNIPADEKTAVNHETKETKPKDLQVVTTDRSKPTEPSSRRDTCPERISNSTRYGKLDMKPSREKNGSRVEKFDPVIGISVIVLTLVIMLVWGRLCAILCTSAWCYFLPRLRDAAALAKRKRSGSDGSSCLPDLNSESYKRKVVMDGFLGRQNRVSLS
ncbi:hypothetical protein Bca4012_046682 [Brassica carinata]|uniref:BnaC09g47680D protein n=2 Tax=Brassica napus TaxID=3708 RepID=A0A078G7Z9_BRANA|nr:uncharacterized protein At5g23160-like [Brassica napus]KAH0861312.1 hypothetical protein HID58_089573 [Brassica napus]CAF1788779.1 unnamed protein product [Brassica napus]CDY21524.1 BnaC09g47680D [Brassica napus]